MSAHRTEDKLHVWSTGFLQCSISCPRGDRQRRCIHPAPWGISVADSRRSSVGGSIRTSCRGSGSSTSTKEFRVGIRQFRSASSSASDQATKVCQFLPRGDENGLG